MISNGPVSQANDSTLIRARATGAVLAVPTRQGPHRHRQPVASTDAACVSVAYFVAHFFIPDHVEPKGFSGRTHYHCMLKHILRPETVDRLFRSGGQPIPANSKAIPDWPYMDDMPVSQINERQVRAIVSAALNEGYSVQTVAQIRNTLGSIMVHAKKKNLVPGETPARAIQLEN